MSPRARLGLEVIFLEARLIPICHRLALRRHPSHLPKKAVRWGQKQRGRKRAEGTIGGGERNLIKKLWTKVAGTTFLIDSANV